MGGQDNHRTFVSRPPIARIKTKAERLLTSRPLAFLGPTRAAAKFILFAAIFSIITFVGVLAVILEVNKAFVRPTIEDRVSAIEKRLETLP